MPPSTRRAVALALLLAALSSSPLFAKTLAAKADGTVVRKTASPKAEALYRAAKHYPFEPLERSGEFTRVRDFEGEEGFVETRALETRATCVAVAPVDVRSGPDDARRVLFRAERGAAFRLVETKGAWAKVEHARGRAGYVRLASLWTGAGR